MGSRWQPKGIMPFEQHKPHNWRIALCNHGPECKDHRRKECWFAHSLDALRPPNEAAWRNPKVWYGGVDRWYGQDVPQRVVTRVQWYYDNTPPCDVPLFVHALRWYLKRDAEGEYDHFPADFGLAQAWDSVYMARGGQRPFDWAPGLWTRVEHRRRRLLAVRGTRRVPPQLPWPMFPTLDRIAHHLHRRSNWECVPSEAREDRRVSPAPPEVMVSIVQAEGEAGTQEVSPGPAALPASLPPSTTPVWITLSSTLMEVGASAASVSPSSPPSSTSRRNQMRCRSAPPRHM